MLVFLMCVVIVLALLTGMVVAGASKGWIGLAVFALAACLIAPFIHKALGFGGLNV